MENGANDTNEMTRGEQNAEEFWVNFVSLIFLLEFY
jgi:hypothetical protein